MLYERTYDTYAPPVNNCGNNTVCFVMQSRYEFEEQLREKINTTFNAQVDLSLTSQAQFYFDALWLVC